MIELLKQLCILDGTSGDEGAVREFVISQIKDHCEYKTDNLGNIIAFKKGKDSSKKLMIAAHMDEIGFLCENRYSAEKCRFESLLKT